MGMGGDELGRVEVSGGGWWVHCLIMSVEIRSF